MLDGEIEISMDGERLGFVGKSAFFGETTIIDYITGKGGDGGELRTRTCRASVDSELACMRKDDLSGLIEKYPELFIRLTNFNKVGSKLPTKVRKTPSWPRSWANFSLSYLYSHWVAWANLYFLGPNFIHLSRS